MSKIYLLGAGASYGKRIELETKDDISCTGRKGAK